MLALQFHTQWLTGFAWETETHRFVANVHDVRGVNIAAFHKNIFRDKDSELTERLNKDCTLTDFLALIRRKMKEGATPKLLRTEGFIV